MARAAKTCSVAGCAAVVAPGRSRCLEHDRAADAARRPTGNPYGLAAHRRFRAGVLARNPICVVCMKRSATVADHYPRTRKQLTEAGLDPDDQQYGRGLCRPCHSAYTAAEQPGGWNNRAL